MVTFTRHQTNFRPVENSYVQLFNSYTYGTIKTVRKFRRLAVRKPEGQLFSRYGRKFDKCGVNTQTSDNHLNFCSAYLIGARSEHHSRLTGTGYIDAW